MKNRHCASIEALVPGYMDGELSEEQAAPLRRHLLSCPACRGAAQELSSFSHWFPAQPAVEVPQGFSARVARAAFAGVTPGRGLEPEAPAQPSPSEAPGLKSFVLALTSIAAGLLLCLALFMAQQRQPQGPELSAEPLPNILEELDRLNGSGIPDSPPAAWPARR